MVGQLSSWQGLEAQVVHIKLEREVERGRTRACCTHQGFTVSDTFLRVRPHLLKVRSPSKVILLDGEQASKYEPVGREGEVRLGTLQIQVRTRDILP